MMYPKHLSTICESGFSNKQSALKEDLIVVVYLERETSDEGKEFLKNAIVRRLSNAFNTNQQHIHDAEIHNGDVLTIGVSEPIAHKAVREIQDMMAEYRHLVAADLTIEENWLEEFSKAQSMHVISQPSVIHDMRHVENGTIQKLYESFRNRHAEYVHIQTSSSALEDTLFSDDYLKKHFADHIEANWTGFESRQHIKQILQTIFESVDHEREQSPNPSPIGHLDGLIDAAMIRYESLLDKNGSDAVQLFEQVSHHYDDGTFNDYEGRFHRAIKKAIDQIIYMNSLSGKVDLKAIEPNEVKGYDEFDDNGLELEGVSGEAGTLAFRRNLYNNNLFHPNPNLPSPRPLTELISAIVEYKISMLDMKDDYKSFKALASRCDELPSLAEREIPSKTVYHYLRGEQSIEPAPKGIAPGM